jgi:hypothetical protein
MLELMMEPGVPRDIRVLIFDHDGGIKASRDGTTLPAAAPVTITAVPVRPIRYRVVARLG